MSITINFSTFELVLATKFHCNHTVFGFLTKFEPKGYYWSVVGQINIPMEFNILELV